MHRGGVLGQTMEQRGEIQVWMQEELHDLCQPLTALQCRLALATMTRKKDHESELKELRATVTESLVECERLIGHVRRMQHGIGDGEVEQ